MLGTRIAKLYLRLRGWRFETPLPKQKKYIVVAYPHTSNWDGLNLMMCATSVGLPISWMIKRSWVDSPIGPWLKRIGAVSIDRSKSNNLVDQMIEEFNGRDELVLVVPPEGTRASTDYWKSGFYHIALGAKVPVSCGYLDFERKVGGVGEPIEMTGNVVEDMDKIRAFYAKVAPVGAVHEHAGPIRLRAEDEVSESVDGG